MKLLCTKCDGEAFDERTQRVCDLCAGAGKIDACGEKLRLNGSEHFCELVPKHAGDHVEGSVRWEIVRAGVT